MAATSGLDDATVIATLLADPAAGDDDPDDNAEKGPDAEASDGGGGEVGPDPDAGPEPELEPELDPEPEPLGCAGLSPGQGRVEVRVELSTLLGLDEHPGEVAGWGPVHAELGRDLVRAHTGGQWRLALTDPAGQLLSAGITRRRPTGWAHNDGPGGIVELQVPVALLDELTPEQCGAWAGIINEFRGLARQQTNAASAVSTADPRRRFPAVALRRYIQIRDRHCHFPPCRTPAASTDIDHTLDYSHGGPTVAANLGGICRRDHRLKGEGGWQLRQPEPGHFLWISPLGRRYPVRPPPIIEPMPHPTPREQLPGPGWLPADHDWEDTTIGPDTGLGNLRTQESNRKQTRRHSDFGELGER